MERSPLGGESTLYCFQTLVLPRGHALARTAAGISCEASRSHSAQLSSYSRSEGDFPGGRALPSFLPWLMPSWVVTPALFLDKAAGITLTSITSVPCAPPSPRVAPQAPGWLPKPQCGSPKPQGSSPNPQSGSPKPQSGSPKPQGGSPKPQSGSPKPQGGSPKPQGGAT